VGLGGSGSPLKKSASWAARFGSGACCWALGAGIGAGRSATGSGSDRGERFAGASPVGFGR
jgi:hypothetical protein